MKQSYKRRKTKDDKEVEKAAKEAEAQELQLQKDKANQYDELRRQFDYQAEQLRMAQAFSDQIVADQIVKGYDKEAGEIEYTDEILKFTSKKKGPFNPAGQKYRWSNLSSEAK